jgi:soluble lytic murein transglycosylase-like protein
VRRELFTAITPFVRGARLGAYVTGATLALSLVGAVGVLTLQPSATSTTEVVATDAPSVPPAARPMKARAETEIDRALLAAIEDVRPGAVGDVLLELSREAADVAQSADQADPAQPAEAAPPATPAAPAVPAAPPLVVSGDPLREVIAEYFPDQVDFAYNVVMCESAGNARAISRAGYYGLWQFDLATWQSVGGTGLPSNASVEEQMARARALFDARGWQPWGCA